MDDGERRSGKRDRLARLTRLITVLRAHPDGVRVGELARRVDTSVRTVYRDLDAIDRELQVGVWSEGGLWGVAGEDFLPPLKLTLSEAMAVVLSARLMVRYADKYDPDLAAAFEKLEEGLPPVLAEHVDRTLGILSSLPRDERFRRHVHLLTRAWSERRVVSLDYDPPRHSRYGAVGERRRAVVRPYLIEPSLQTHALYLIGWDETRDGLRTFKIERILDAALTPNVRPARGRDRGLAPAGVGHHRGPVGGGGRAALRPHGGRTRRGGDLAPDAAGRARAGWLPRLAGDGQRDDRDPAVDPLVGRRGRGAGAGGAP